MAVGEDTMLDSAVVSESPDAEASYVNTQPLLLPTTVPLLTIHSAGSPGCTPSSESTAEPAMLQGWLNGPNSSCASVSGSIEVVLRKAAVAPVLGVETSPFPHPSAQSIWSDSATPRARPSTQRRVASIVLGPRWSILTISLWMCRLLVWVRLTCEYT